jgi:hypothetical protein
MFRLDAKDVRFHREAGDLAPTFYLKSQKLIEQKMRGPMKGPDLLKMKNGGIKADELKWTGLTDAAGHHCRRVVAKLLSEGAGEGHLDPNRLQISAETAEKALRAYLDAYHEKAPEKLTEALDNLPAGFHPRPSAKLRTGERAWTSTSFQC